MPHTTLRRLAAPLAGAVIVLASVGPAVAAESLPGPPARPGERPIGGAQLKGTRVVYKPVPGVTIAPPPMDAASWILADADTGNVLAAKGPHQRYRPASTLKTLTALTLMPRLDPASTYKATKTDATAEGSAVGLAVGVKYTINDLWHALLLPSANDAASALANANGGFDKTIDQMNAKALRLQAFDTVAKSPSGLDADGQWTSAYDMALIGRAALALPEFVEISSKKTAKFPDMELVDGVRTKHTIYGENRLLNHDFPGVIAGKTGFTTEAKRTYWTAVKRGDRTLIISMFRIVGSTEAAAQDLFNWGFAHANELEPIGELVNPLTDAQLATSKNPLAVTELDGAVPAEPPAPVVNQDERGFPWLLLFAIAALLIVALAALRVRAVNRQHAALRAREQQRRGGAQTFRDDEYSDANFALRSHD